MGRGLLKKYLLAILGVGAISIVSVLSVVLFVGRDAMKESIGAGFKELAEATGENIDNKIKNHIEIAKLMASADAVVNAVTESNLFYEGTPEEIDDRIKQIEDRWTNAEGVNVYLLEIMSNRASRYLTDNLTRSQLYNNMIVTNSKGAVVASTQRPEHYSYGKSAWWKNTFNNGLGKVIVGDIEKNEKGANIFAIAVPIKQEDLTVGVLYMVHEVDQFFKAVTQAKIGKTDHSMLVNAAGQVIFSPEPSAEKLKFETSEMAEIIQNKSGWRVTNQDVHFPGREAINGFAPVMASTGKGGGIEKDWYVVTSQDPSETFATVDRLLQFVALVGIAGLVIVMILGWFATERLLRPINVLIRGAEVIGGGDLDHRIHIKSGDELEDLALKINEMALKLKIFYIKLDEKVKERTVKLEHRNKELDLLYTVTSVLNSAVNLNELIGSMLKTMQKIMNADHVLLWVAEPDGNAGWVAGSLGINAADLKSEQMAGLIGVISRDIKADNTRIWQCENVTVDYRLEEINYNDQTYLSFVGIPAVSQQRTIGFILLMYKQIYALTPWEEHVVIPIGNQIGIALEHYMLYEKTKKI